MFHSATGPIIISIIILGLLETAGSERQQGTPNGENGVHSASVGHQGGHLEDKSGHPGDTDEHGNEPGHRGDKDEHENEPGHHDEEDESHELGPTAHHGHGKEKERVFITPEDVLSSVPEEVPFQKLAKYEGKCDLRKYRDSDFGKSWALADRHNISGGAEIFSRFTNVVRKGRNHSWYQEICDAWPYSLMECAPKDKKNKTSPTVCNCLRTQLTKFVAVEERFKGVRGKVCRVKFGGRCSYKATALRCAHNYKCLSGICRGSYLQPPGTFILAGFVLELFRRYL